MGGLRLLHPRTPGPPVPITGLAPALVGSVGGIGPEGASCVVRRPSDGALLVGNISPAPGSVVGLHILTLNGTAVASDATYDVGGVSGSQFGQISQCALLPNGDILVAVSGLGTGALSGQILGLVKPSVGPPSTPGTVVPVAVSPPPPFGFANAVTTDAAGTTAYVGMFGAMLISQVWSVPLPNGGAPSLVADLPAGVTSLARQNDGTLIAACIGGPPNLFSIDPTAPSPGNVTPIVTSIGEMNAVAVETVTGNFAVGRTNSSGPPSAAFWITPGGAATLLSLGPPFSAWGVLSGVAIHPDPESYGSGTPGTNAYAWSLAPNAGGLPTLGNASFNLTLSSIPACAPGVYAVSLGKAAPPIPIAGVSLNIDPALLVFVAPLPSPCSTTATVPLGIPPDPTLVNGKVFVQTFHFDAGAPSGIAASDGVEVTVL
ncbi:MAG TPA: hypothetical protein VKF62_00800 [Planctomycetota bacterium]|nr:hypothetical protein [Planctomycetota bacterium]